MTDQYETSYFTNKILAQTEMPYSFQTHSKLQINNADFDHLFSSATYTHIVLLKCVLWIFILFVWPADNYNSPID